MMCTDVLILAGGVGERLWPFSTESRPKQFLRVAGNKSFLQSALERAWSLHVPGNIYIITRSTWTDLVLEDIVDLAERNNLPDLPGKTVVMGEPFGKNTAPAAAWLSRMLETQSPGGETSLLLMASDHVIGTTEIFIRDVEAASWFTARRHLVSFAIAPRYPSTGYGYITAGRSLEGPSGNGATVFEAAAFREKPDEQTARRYIEEGNAYWNSGLYAFRCDFLLEELEKHTPGIASAFSRPIMPQYRTVRGVRVMEPHDGVLAAYEATPSVSIDYAVSEKCERSVSVLARFDWDDVGSWDSLIQYLEPEAGSASLVNAPGCYVNSDIPVALCGAEDLVVIIRDGKAFIARKGQTELVKEALAGLRDKDAL